MTDERIPSRDSPPLLHRKEKTHSQIFVFDSRLDPKHPLSMTENFGDNPRTFLTHAADEDC